MTDRVFNRGDVVVEIVAELNKLIGQLYLTHSILHALIGGCIFFVLIEKDSRLSGRYVTFLLGMFLGVFPDILKFFGDLTSHSIIFTPFYSFILALMIYKVYHVKILDTWIAILVTIVGSHILIDLLGNGVAPFYPFKKEEYSFYIIAHEELYVSFLFVGIIVATILKKMKSGFRLSLCILFILFCMIGVSKIVLEDKLEDYFREEEPYLTITYPTNINWFEWEFQVRTEEYFYTGTSSYFPIKIDIQRETEVIK